MESVRLNVPKRMFLADPVKTSMFHFQRGKIPVDTSETHSHSEVWH